MTFPRLHRKVLFVLFVLSAIAAAPVAAQTFQAGAATSNITPPLGLSIIGGPSSKTTHIHDELQVRCLVLDDGKTRLALAVCDLISIHEQVCNEACQRIEERLKIPRSHVLISATHTHSASSPIRRDPYRDEPLDDYQRLVAQRIADGVACAVNNLRPAEMAFGAVDAPEHVFNRRWFMRPGAMPSNPFGTATDLVKMNPPPGSPNLVEPAGPADPTISFLAFREPGGRPIAVFTAYSLHYVGGVGKGHISADYFAAYASELAKLLDAERLDPPFVGILANGTSGDLNNTNFRQPKPTRQPYEQIRFVAGAVAAKVKGALDQAAYRSDATLDARFRAPKIAWRRPTEAQLKWAKAAVAAERAGSQSYAHRALRMAEYPETTSVPLQAVRIGDTCIGTMPCEVFCEIGIEFRRRAAQQPAFIVELANGSMGYLPTPRQHKFGGYETWLGANLLEREASDKLLAKLIAMSEELKLPARVRE